MSFYERLHGEGFLNEDSRRASWSQGFLEPTSQADMGHCKIITGTRKGAKSSGDCVQQLSLNDKRINVSY